jgi:Domain of unknown function (DUF4142)
MPLAPRRMSGRPSPLAAGLRLVREEASADTSSWPLRVLLPHQGPPGQGSRGADQPARSGDIADEQVRGFADRMARTPQRRPKLLSLAQGAANASKTKLDEQQQVMLEQLSQLSGEDFVRQYMQQQVQVHQAAVKLFGSEALQPSGPVDSAGRRIVTDLARASADGAGKRQMDWIGEAAEAKTPGPRIEGLLARTV